MTTKLTMCFVPWNFTSFSSRPSSTLLAFPNISIPSRRPLLASFSVRKHNLSSPIKSQAIEKDGNLHPNDDDNTNKENSSSAQYFHEENARAEDLTHSRIITPSTTNKDVTEAGEQTLGGELLNLLDMMIDVDKISDIHLFSEARSRAIKDLHNILQEKETMQDGIKALEKILEETEAQLKVAPQGNENMEILENERSFLESALKDLKSKSLVFQENLLEIFSKIGVESKELEDKVESLQLLLNNAIKLANQPIEVLQENLNFQRDVKRLRAEEPVEGMPWDFWSQLLLKIDGWSLEKKISVEDANIIRGKVWKRSRDVLDTYLAVKGKSEQEVISAFLALSVPSSGLYAIHIATEMALVAKVGGLGDVVSGLCKALRDNGHLVEIILPKYDCMQYDHIKDLRVLNVEIESSFDKQLHKNKIWVGTVEGLPVYFIESRHHDKFFGRGKIYGENDDFKRFSYFSRAALEFLHQSGKKPDIIHCHDWPTALVAPLYWEIYVRKGLNSARICFTCHNFEYQGIASPSELASCGLDVRRLNRSDRLQDNKAHNKVNVVKGGIVFSNAVTTVSPTYAREVKTEDGGQGLQSTLDLHSHKFIGILNGIDAQTWNPATDPYLNSHYDANDLQGKSENKKFLRMRLGLSSSDDTIPLVGCVTRLVPHKGVNLIIDAIHRTLELGGQFILLGSSPIPEIQEEFEDLASRFQIHDHIRLILKYDERLAHSIHAGSDMFIIPSIFEPCGLTQMISMRYGTIPIARKTGGLNDSVFDINDDTVPSEFRNGFAFLDANKQGIGSALERAFDVYKNNPESWKQLVQKDMNIDVSWKSSAARYEDVYYKSLGRSRPRNTNESPNMTTFTSIANARPS